MTSNESNPIGENMQQFILDMPPVSKCTAANCAFNTKGQCHAKAVTIGDQQNPGCDTFFTSSLKSERVEAAGVGACKVDSCWYNKNFECTAEKVEVGKDNGQIKCVTFRVYEKASTSA